MKTNKSWVMALGFGALLMGSCRKDLQDGPAQPEFPPEPLHVAPLQNSITQTGLKLTSMAVIFDSLASHDNEFAEMADANTAPGANGYDVEMIFSSMGNNTLMRLRLHTADVTQINTIGTQTAYHPVHASITLNDITFQNEGSPTDHFATVGNSTIMNAGNEVFYYINNPALPQVNYPVSRIEFNSLGTIPITAYSWNGSNYEIPFNSNALVEQFMDNSNGSTRFLYVTGAFTDCFSNNPAVIENGDAYSYRLDKVSDQPLQYSCSNIYPTP